ncbi:RYamide receptor [Nymphon striatum]|nr:RYamide receptor [Nymphon striatum]
MILQFFFPLVVLIFTYTRIAIAVWGKKTPGETAKEREKTLEKSKRKLIEVNKSSLVFPFSIVIQYEDVPPVRRPGILSGMLGHYTHHTDPIAYHHHDDCGSISLHSLLAALQHSSDSGRPVSFNMESSTHQVKIEATIQNVIHLIIN